MSLVTRLTDLATRIATECKSLRTLMNGNAADNSALTTTAKTNLVAAINELKAGLDAAAAGAAGINDAAASGTSTYSSNKINAQIAAAVAGLVNGAPAALDTLAEIAAQLAADEAGAASLATALGYRVRFDAAQALDATQKAQALANIGAAALAHVHVIADITGLQGALDGKSNTGHTHAISDVTGLSGALSGKQDADPTLAALAAVVTSANKLIYATNADTFSTTDLTLLARQLLDDVDQAAMQATLGLGSAATQPSSAFAPASHVGAGGAAHAQATGTVDGFMSAADKSKLDGVAAGANNYVHPSGDGNQHVPATGTTSNGKVLKAGATAGSAAWGFVAWAEILNLPTTISGFGITDAYTKSQMDTALAGKSNTGHVHAISEVTGLQYALDAKANAADVGDTTTNFVTTFNSGLV